MTSPAPALAPHLPKVLARHYKVLGPVGRGAIAEVVRARDERTGEEVALKILYPHLRESATVVERFRREVEIVRRIAHPHVLTIRDIVDSDGHLFLVMDFHPGGDLADRLARNRRLGNAEIQQLAAQLCGALGAAHRAGVVHRDVKPSNVLCGPGPGVDLDVRLCDFGLARTADLSGLTTANAVLGTPEYMAPEVVTDGHADPRSDLYSLGVVLFEAATGRLPFYGDSPYQLMRQHVDLEPPRARSLAPDLPPAVDDAIARALAKDPLDRFATAEDLERALADGSRDASTALVPAHATTAARRTCRHCGGWVVDAAAVCVDCGAATLRLEREPGGVAVLVWGPGKFGDKIDAWKHVALYKILDELPPDARPIARGGRQAPRVPFYVAKGLTQASAGALIARLESIGLMARIETRRALAPWEVREKLSQMVSRPVAGLGVSFYVFLHIDRLFPHAWSLWVMVGSLVAMAAGMGALFTSALVRCIRPLVPGGAGREGLDPSGKRLAALLGRLESRQDRRLCARILERLVQIEALGRAEVAGPLTARAAEVAGALANFDARRSADASVAPDPTRALDELRREEMVRVVLRADLLRAASRLDDLCVILARSNALASSDDVPRLEEEIRELTVAVEAEDELAALLGDTE